MKRTAWLGIMCITLILLVACDPLPLRTNSECEAKKDKARDICYYNKGIQSLDPDYCRQGVSDIANYDSGIGRSFCFYAVAYQTNNPSLCYEIRNDDNGRDICGLAVKSKLGNGIMIGG